MGGDFHGGQAAPFVPIRAPWILRIRERGRKHGRRNRAERGVHRGGIRLHIACNRLGRYLERGSAPVIGQGRGQLLRRVGIGERGWRDGRRRSARERRRRDERRRGLCVHQALRRMGHSNARTHHAHRLRRRGGRRFREIGVGQQKRKRGCSWSLRGRRQRRQQRIRLRVHAAGRRVDGNGRASQAQTVRRRSGRLLRLLGVRERGRKHHRRRVARGRRQRERLRIRLRVYETVQRMDDDGRTGQAHAL